MHCIKMVHVVWQELEKAGNYTKESWKKIYEELYRKSVGKYYSSCIQCGTVFGEMH